MLRDREKPLVLLIDDNVEIRELLRMVLQKHYGVITADDGSQGFRLAIQEFPDLIVVDVSMPTMDGLEFARLLRGSSDLKHTFLIMLSGKQTPTDVIAGLDAGADVYLTKPFKIEVVAAQIRALFRRRA